MEEVTFGQHTYRVYRNAKSGYIAFVAKVNFTSAAVDHLEIVKWVMAKGWLSSQATLDQICFGVEVVSTDDQEATFGVTEFSIDTRLKSGHEESGSKP